MRDRRLAFANKMRRVLRTPFPDTLLNRGIGMLESDGVADLIDADERADLIESARVRLAGQDETAEPYDVLVLRLYMLAERLRDQSLGRERSIAQRVAQGSRKVIYYRLVIAACKFIRRVLLLAGHESWDIIDIQEEFEQRRHILKYELEEDGANLSRLRRTGSTLGFKAAFAGDADDDGFDGWIAPEDRPTF